MENTKFEKIIVKIILTCLTAIMILVIITISVALYQEIKATFSEEEISYKELDYEITYDDDVNDFYYYEEWKSDEWKDGTSELEVIDEYSSYEMLPELTGVQDFWIDISKESEWRDCQFLKLLAENLSAQSTLNIVFEDTFEFNCFSVDTAEDFPIVYKDESMTFHLDKTNDWWPRWSEISRYVK